jgi:hypothetical protein
MLHKDSIACLNNLELVPLLKVITGGKLSLPSSIFKADVLQLKSYTVKSYS